jgi:hypothetical protein
MSESQIVARASSLESLWSGVIIPNSTVLFWTVKVLN